VRRYLDDPPTAAELGEVVARLGLEPWDVAGPRGARGRHRPARERASAPPGSRPSPPTRALQRPIITAADGTTVIDATRTR
jgi:arsenate reductase